MDETQIQAHLTATPPTCVRAFHLSPGQLSQPFDGALTTVWHVACSCGADIGKVLGYPLRDLKSDYTGGIFVSPISFQCGSCARATQILDTDVHGYHAEVGKMKVASARLKFAVRDSTNRSPVHTAPTSSLQSMSVSFTGTLI